MHKIALVLAIAAVGEGLIALHLVQELRTERANAQTLQARVTELERKSPQQSPGATFIAVPTQPTASPFTTVIGAGAPAERAPVASSTVTAANAMLSSRALPPDQQQMREHMAASIERQRTLLRDPEYREAMRTQQKMMLMRGNPDVAQDLNLTADQVDRLFGTLADQTLRSMDNMNMWEEQSDPAKLHEQQRKAAEQMRVNEAELKGVLGDAKYREWQEYQQMAGVRWEASRVRTSLANAGVPLDESLAKPLLKVLQEQQKQEMQRLQQYAAKQSNAVTASVGFVTAGTGGSNIIQLMTNSQESLAKTQQQQREALARVLTAEQLEIIEEEQNAELQMQRVQLQIMRAQQAAGGLDPAQPASEVYFQANQAFVPAAPASD
jgi:hypothetical protein